MCCVHSTSVLLPALAVLVVTGGCLPARAVIQTYQLNPVLDAQRSPRAITRPVPATLLVTLPTAGPGFDTPRMAYVVRPHEVSYYAHNQWVDTPARMLAPPLVRALEQSGIWEAVAMMPTVARGAYRLDLEHFVLQHEFLSRPSRVHLALRAQLIDVRRQCVMGATDFDVLEPAPSDDPYGGVLAANRAARKLLEQLVAWLGTYMNKGARNGCEGASSTSDQSPRSSRPSSTRVFDLDGNVTKTGPHRGLEAHVVETISCHARGPGSPGLIVPAIPPACAQKAPPSW